MRYHVNNYSTAEVQKILPHFRRRQYEPFLLPSPRLCVSARNLPAVMAPREASVETFYPAAFAAGLVSALIR